MSRPQRRMNRSLPNSDFYARIHELLFPSIRLSPRATGSLSSGYISSWLKPLGNNPSSTEKGLPLTTAATHIDGLVLALTPNHHIYNYRSSILHCFATPVTDQDEKIWAWKRSPIVWWRTDGKIRASSTRTEMISTQILRLKNSGCVHQSEVRVTLRLTSMISIPSHKSRLSRSYLKNHKTYRYFMSALETVYSSDSPYLLLIDSANSLDGTFVRLMADLIWKWRATSGKLVRKY